MATVPGKSQPTLNLESLKWFGLALMLCDHLAVVFLPGELWIRLPGRMVFPIFAALMALHLKQGYPPDKYLRKLLPFAILAQGGYALAFGALGGVWPLNVLFTLAAGAMMLKPGWWGYGLLLSLFSEFPLGAPAIYLLVRGQVLAAGLCLGGSMALLGWPPAVAGLSVLLVAGVWTLVQKAPPGPRVLPWWVAYIFYPAHLWLIGLLKGG